MGLFIDLYQNLIALFSYSILIAMLLLFSFTKPKTLRLLFGKISGKAWICLLLVFFAALVLRLFVFPHYHQMYLDEQLYLEYASNINSDLKPQVCEYFEFYRKDCDFLPHITVGWPALLSLFFSIFGQDTEAVFHFSSVIGSFSVILLFLLAYLIFKNQNVALWSSFFMALTPLYVTWSNTAGSNMPSLFFILLTLVLFFAYVETRDRKMMALFALSTLFSFIVRFETIIVALPLLLVSLRLGLFGKSPAIRALKLLYPSLVIALLSLVAILTILSGRFFSRDWGDAMESYFFSLFPFFQVASFHYLYLILALMSIFLMKESREGIIHVSTIFVFFFATYLPIFSEDRMALIPGAFLIMLSAFSIERISAFLEGHVRHIELFIIAVLAALLGMSLSLAYGNLYAMDSAKMLETYSVAQIKKEIPGSCYVISEWPLVFSPSSIKAIYAHAILKRPEKALEIAQSGGCIYYFYDGYCSENPISRSPGSMERCRQALRKFDYETERTFTMGGAQYSLYRINGVASPQSAERRN